MSIHSLPDIPGVDVADLIARQEYAEDTIESQDNPTPEDWASLRQERRAAEALYYRCIRREGLRQKRRERANTGVHEAPPYGD